jgi:hypothetical protein
MVAASTGPHRGLSFPTTRAGVKDFPGLNPARQLSL